MRRLDFRRSGCSVLWTEPPGLCAAPQDAAVLRFFVNFSVESRAARPAESARFPARLQVSHPSPSQTPGALLCPLSFPSRFEPLRRLRPSGRHNAPFRTRRTSGTPGRFSPRSVRPLPRQWNARRFALPVSSFRPFSKILRPPPACAQPLLPQNVPPFPAVFCQNCSKPCGFPGIFLSFPAKIMVFCVFKIFLLQNPSRSTILFSVGKFDFPSDIPQ